MASSPDHHFGTANHIAFVDMDEVGSRSEVGDAVNNVTATLIGDVDGF